MQTDLISNINIQLYHKSPTKNEATRTPRNNIKELQQDVFEKQYSAPSFTSVNQDMAILRKYANDLGCAYTDGKMIKAETFNFIMNKMKSMKSDKAVINFVSKYAGLMDEFERKILSFYKFELKQKPHSSIEEITQERFLKSASRLQPMYLIMVKNLEALSKEMNDTKHARRLQATIEAWKQDLKNGNFDDAIAYNKYHTIIEKMKFSKQELPLRSKILNTLGTLPNPSEDFDAFMVKYKNSSRRVIIKRLLTPYTVSIEHIKAKAKGGHASAIGNCMLVRTKDNNARGHSDIMFLHPEREENIKNYFRRVVSKINNGGMKELLFYPFELKKTIEEETRNKINLDKEIAKLNISEEEAYKGFIV